MILSNPQNNQETFFPDYAPRNHYKIQVFPHVKKFLKRQYGLNVIKPIQVDGYSPLGKSVMLALRDNRKRAEYNDQYRDKLTSEITLVLTKEMMELSPKLSKLLKISIDMDGLFKQHLLTWIFAQQTTGIPPFTACKYFLAYFGIEEKEYSLDAAYKFWQRSNEK